MSYATMNVTQMVVANAAMRAGGNFSLSVQAVDGGGRGPPNFSNDIANLQIVFYNASNAVIGTATSNNTTVFNTWNTYTLNSTNCGGASCSQLKYFVVYLIGNDGGYWAGNAGTNFKNPKLTFTPSGQAASTTNILYNPEFGVYGTYATNSGPNGWSNSTGSWGGNTHPQLLNLNGTLNAAGGGYIAGTNSTNGQAGGYPQVTEPTYASSITATQQNHVNAAAVTRAGITKNGIYIDQVGNNNTVNINQVGGYNQVSGIGTTYAPVRGDLNTITIRQGDPGNPAGKNLIEMSVQGTGSNTLNLNQGRDTTGNYTGTDVGNHYQYINVSGYSNTVATNQQNAGGTVGHYLEANVIGNYNTVGLIQTGGTTQKQTFATVNGNNNTLNASQTGLGAHYLDVSLMGNGNSAIVNQYGNTANAATISLTNAGGPASVNLTQTGGQVYNISTVCVTAGGCAPVTVRQGN
jgi:Curlin associated repeat